jgi:hypothetical protein
MHEWIQNLERAWRLTLGGGILLDHLLPTAGARHATRAKERTMIGVQRR